MRDGERGEKRRKMIKGERKVAREREIKKKK